MDMITKRTDSS